MRGVIYLSTVPPYMGKRKLVKLFQQYGEIDRVHLTPEPKVNRKRRIKDGGNKRKCFTEAWIEFIDKADAKRVALMFNNQTTGGKKQKNFYREDIWNIRYLSKFTWEHLLQKIQYDKALTQQQVRAEATLARKTNRFFKAQVEKSREIEGIQKKRGKFMEKVVRNFSQKDPIEE